MWYLKKDMFWKERIFFIWCIIFKMVCLLFVFWSVWPSSVIQRTHILGTRSCICRCFHKHINFYNRICNHITDCMHNCTNDLFGRFRVPTPALAAWSFCGSRVRFPGPDHLFLAHCILGIRHSPPQMEQQVALQTKKTLIRGKKLSAWLVSLAVWGSSKISTCDLKHKCLWRVGE